MIVKMDAALFDQVKPRQEVVWQELASDCAEQQVAREIVYTWKGGGGDHLLAYMEKLEEQTLSGIYLTAAMNTQTRTSQAGVEEADSRLAAVASQLY